MNKMKYLLNHPWKFEYPVRAYMSGLFQATSMILVTIVNYYVILVSEDILDVVMNFLALLVIADIDNFFFKTHSQRDLVV